MKNKFAEYFLRPVLLAALILLSFYSIWGCAMGADEKVLYSVEFDTRLGDQNARVLDYRYMRDTELLMAPFPEELNGSKGMAQSGKAYWMPLGTSLYVKWQDQTTGKIYEDNVDLKGKLPKNMSKKNILFTVTGPQLCVYLVFSGQPSDSPMSERPYFAKAFRFIQLYPK